MPKPNRGGQRGITAQPQTPQQPQAQQTITKAEDAQDIAALRKYAQDTLGITLDSNLDNCDFTLVKQAVMDYEFLASEFPQWVGTMKGIDEKDFGQPYTNAATDGKTVHFSKWYEDPSGFAQRVANATAKGYYPQNTTNMTTAVHEMGHIFEQAYIDKHLPADGTFNRTVERIEQWNKHKAASTIISNAAKAAKKLPDGKGKKVDQLISGVSTYATKSRGEALAECVRDYYINRDKAQPLSRAVWAELKKEFG